MSRQHNVKVSERMAERIKINVGAALTELGEDAPEDYIVHGPNRITALPMEVPYAIRKWHTVWRSPFLRLRLLF